MRGASESETKDTFEHRARVRLMPTQTHIGALPTYDLFSLVSAQVDGGGGGSSSSTLAFSSTIYKIVYYTIHLRAMRSAVAAAVGI